MSRPLPPPKKAAAELKKLGKYDIFMHNFIQFLLRYKFKSTKSHQKLAR
jgi:hypothetical protein